VENEAHSKSFLIGPLIPQSW